MYDWLSDSLRDSGTVVTANRRLARDLASKFAENQVTAGKTAWRSPPILVWNDWLVTLASDALDQENLPTRINMHQSQLLWERCLRKEIGSSEINISSLVRLARETWQRLADWQVTIKEVARAAQNEDQRLFASVAGRYLGILERENWIDDAGLAGLILQLLTNNQCRLSGRHTFAGFDRRRPVIAAIHDAMIAAGVGVNDAPEPAQTGARSLQVFENSAAELRSAGAWARQQIEVHPDARIALIVNDLDKNAEGISHCVREGLTPGWQHGHQTLFDALNVSYGRRLADYPAISVALKLLHWLVSDISSTDVSLLLRSPLLGTSTVGGRSRLELRLRQLPERSWSPSMVTAELRGRDDGENVGDWLQRLAAFSKSRRALPKGATPAEWAVFIDGVLKSFLWPGQAQLDSKDFQLINRWRELLNEFARLGMVSTTMPPGAAIARLEMLAGETLFQPESASAVVNLMGPLEASGAQFDAIWISGVTTANWPPAGRPSPLVSRRLQEMQGMPDCTPADTLGYAERVLAALFASAESVVCSYAVTVDDAEQTASDLLVPLALFSEDSCADPGWYARTLTDSTYVQVVDDDVPQFEANEKLSGGAGIIQRQMQDPVAAFVHGRLGARAIYPQAIGIPAMTRGNLVHDALYNLYIDLPSSEAIRGWQGDDLTARIEAAVNFAFARAERNVDAVLHQLLILERRRVSNLLRQFVAIDGNRGEFKVASVEGVFEFVAGNIRLPLRFDRIDSSDDNSIAILDYKTGAKKRLINREKEAQEIQLFVYASATDTPVSALALVNIDSREIAFDGAGAGYTDVDEWPELLQRVKDRIAVACEEISLGDVRINIEQGISSARPLNLLTRFTELRRDNG